MQSFFQTESQKEGTNKVLSGKVKEIVSVEHSCKSYIIGLQTVKNIDQYKYKIINVL